MFELSKTTINFAKARGLELTGWNDDGLAIWGDDECTPLVTMDSNGAALVQGWDHSNDKQLTANIKTELELRRWINANYKGWQ